MILGLLESLLMFGLGAVLGSFGNVVIDRSEDERSIIKGRSECDSCGKKLSWQENIPIWSYLKLKGRCKTCKKPIGIRVLLIEVLMGMGFILMSNYSKLFQIIPNTLFLWGGLITIVADLEKGIIPDWAVGAIGLAGLLKWGLSPTLLIGAGVSFLFFWLLIKITKEKGMGWGDAKLAPVLFYFGGWSAGLWGLIYAFWIGAGVGIIMILLKKKKMKSSLPFGPFMILGLALALIIR